MKLKVVKLGEYGYEHAMLGLSLNHKQPIEKMSKVALKLCRKDKGHNKFLEHITLYIDVTAPRFWWQEFDTYRVGVSKQSESTMHTITRDGHLTMEHFDATIPDIIIEQCNEMYDKGDLIGIKNRLPEGFLQRREVVMSYKVLRNMNQQRLKHRLPHWPHFLKELKSQLEHPELI